MNIDYRAKAEHFATLASRAWFSAATAISATDADAWEERAARYDARATDYRNAARKAA